MIERHERGDVLLLRLAHGKASALDVELCEAISSELAEARRLEPRALVLTGSGSIFSAGVDLFRLTREGAPYVARFLPALDNAIRDLFAMQLPVVAAVNGHAIAGGCILTAACDLRLMASGKGRIGAPELLVGVPFPKTALEVLRFSTPRQHLQKLLYTGATLTPEDALAHGLIDELFDAEQLEARALELANAVGAIDHASFASAKQLLRAGVITDDAAAAEETLRVWSDAATHERINAYLARTVKR